MYSVVIIVVSLYLMFRLPFGICRKDWPHVVPPWHQECSIREAYISRHTTLNQFKYFDPQIFESFLVGKPPHHLLFNKNSIILSQGPSIYSSRTDDLLYEGISSAPQGFAFEALGNHNARVTCMRLFSRIEANQCQIESNRDDNILVTSSSDRFIRMWSKVGNRCFKGHTGPVMTLSDKLLGDDSGKIFASGGEDGTVRLWSINSSGKRGQQASKATLYGHDKAVSLISVAGHKSSLLVSISKNGKVRVWDTTTASSSSRSSCCVGMTSTPVAPVGMKCHESLLYIAAGSSVTAVDLRTMYKAFTVPHQEKLHSFEFLPSKSLLCTGGTGRGNLWDMRRVSDSTKVEPNAELLGHVGPITHVHMDSYKIVTGGPDDDCVNVWDVETGRNANSFVCSAPDGEPVQGCSALAVDGCRIVTAASVGPELAAVVFRDFRNATELKESTSIVPWNESEASLGASKFWDPQISNPISFANMPTAAVLFLLIHHLFLAVAAAPVPGLDSFLSTQARKDPPASNDSFLSLPSSIKSSLAHLSAAHPPAPSSLLSLTLPVPVSVHLVGPSFTTSAPSILSSFVTSAVTSDLFHVITPFAASPHHLSVSHSLHLNPSLSPPSLSTSLSSALSSHLSTHPHPIRSLLTPVPYSVIDEIIRDDYEKEKHDNSFHIYIINLGSPQAKPYAYSYTPGDSSPGSTKCLGSIWTGKDRYLWIDLGAGPVDYGPALSGDGVLPKGEFHPMAALHGRPKSQKALLSDLASLVWSAYQVLLVPSLRIPVPFDNKLVVEFIHINGGSGGSVGLDWNSLERTFRDEANDRGLLLGDQSLSFKKYEMKFSECSICSFAISRATTSYTSRYLFDNYTLIVSEYLDSKRLHQTILESVDEFRRVGKIPEEEFGRVLPVYVFDLDLNAILLLDRYHQSVAFKDMVIAIRTKSTQTVSDYSCNGHHVFTQTRELERPLVGSILQSMWGVSPTHMVWSPRHNSSLVDYTWSVGQTPFGPFSEIPSLSFVQKDAARRNVFLTTLNYSITSGIDILESIGAHGGERKLLGHSRRTEFYQRWNLFRYKLEKSISALSHFDYEMALYYLRSSDHDLYSMHSLVYRASQELEASLVCFEDPPFPWGSFSMSVGVCIVLVYAYAKRDKLFQNKRKQF